MLANFFRYLIGFVVGVLSLISMAVVTGPQPRSHVALQLTPVASAPSARHLELEDVFLLLEDKPCEIGAVRAEADPSIRHRVKGGLVVVKQAGIAPLKLCYFEDGGLVAIVDEQGQSALIPAEYFVAGRPGKPMSKKGTGSF